MPNEYQIERRDRRDGPEVFIARDTQTPGPTGVGATEDEAVISLEKALSRWRRVESGALEQWRSRRFSGALEGDVRDDSRGNAPDDPKGDEWDDSKGAVRDDSQREVRDDAQGEVPGDSRREVRDDAQGDSEDESA